MAKNKTASFKQIFGIPTLNSLFQYVLSNPSIRPSFFHAFLPNINITSSEPLDQHMHPVQGFQVLRKWLHDQQTKKQIKDVRKEDQIIKVYVGDKAAHHRGASKLLTGFIRHFEEIARAFPAPDYDGSMDFVCRLDSGELTLVEMQVLPQDFWDRRALALAALVFGGQLQRGDDWSQLKRVIGLNILGGGFESRGHWPDTPDQFIRYYRLEEQLNQEDPARFLDGIEIIQYSLKNAHDEMESQEKQDWLLFFKKAHMMMEEDVKKQVKTPAVLQAFEMAKIRNMPADVRDRYKDDALKYEKFSIHIRSVIEAENKKIEAEKKGIEAKNKKIEAEKKKIVAKNKKIEAEKKEIEAKNKKTEAKNKKIEAEKKKIVAEKRTREQQFVQYLRKNGATLSEIKKATGLSLEEIKAIEATALSQSKKVTKEV